MWPLVLVLLSLALVKGAFQNMDDRAKLFKGNLVPTTFKPGSMSAEIKVLQGGNTNSRSFKMQREAIRREFRLASDPMGGAWKESHLRLRKLSEKVAKYVDEMEENNDLNTSSIGQGSKFSDNLQMRCDAIYKSLLQDYPCILKREGMKSDLRKQVKFQQQNSIRNYENQESNSKKQFLRGDSSGCDPRYLAQESERCDISRFYQRRESKTDKNKGKSKIVSSNEDSNGHDLYNVSKNHDLLQRAVSHGASLDKERVDAYTWEVGKTYKHHREKIQTFLENLDTTEVMNERLIELTELSLPGIRVGKGLLHTYEAFEHSIQLNIQSRIYNPVRLKRRFPSILSRKEHFNIQYGCYQGEIEKLAHNMSQEFRNLRVKMRMIEELLVYLLKLTEYDSHNFFNILRYQLDECFEATIDHLMHEQNKEIIGKKSKNLKENNSQGKIHEEELHSLHDFDLKRICKNSSIGLIKSFQRFFYRMYFEGFESKQIPTTITKLQFSELKSSLSILIEKTILKQIHFLHKFMMVESPESNCFFRDLRTSRQLGKHLHDTYQNSYNESFKPELEHLLIHEGHSYLEKFLDDAKWVNEEIIIHRVLECTFRSLQNTSEQLSVPLRPEFIEIFAKFTSGNFSIFLLNYGSHKEDKMLEEVELLVENSLDFFLNVPQSFKRIFNLVENEYHEVKLPAQRKTTIPGALDETQYLLNFYTLKFLERFLRKTFYEQLIKPKFNCINIKMKVMNLAISRDNLQRRFFSKSYGLCNFRYFYSNDEIKGKTKESTILSKIIDSWHLYC